MFFTAEIEEELGISVYIEGYFATNRRGKWILKEVRVWGIWVRGSVPPG
jgi:hypothetical protein